MFRILIPNAETRKAFDVSSMLAVSFRDIPIISGNTDGTKSSKRRLRRLFHSNVETLRVHEEAVFIKDLESISQKYSDDKIIFLPIEEETVALFYAFLRKCGARNFVYLLPDEAVFNILKNKKELNSYCAENNLSAPAFYQVSDLDNLPAEKFPILLKPCEGSGSEGQFRLYTPADYSNSVKTTVSKQPYIAQELIGNGHDVKGSFYLYDEKGFVDAYTHERIRTSPPTGGVTVFSRLTHEQDVIDEGKKILDKIGWQGLIMLEFLYDEKVGRYKVIEANPRIWGSIMLSEYGGSHMLTNYVRRCKGDSLVIGHKESDCYIRWLFPVDVLNYIKSFGRIKGFWNFKNTCFINWSYAGKVSAIRFNLHNLFQLKNIKRFLRK